MSNRWKLYLVPWLGFAIALVMHLWNLGHPARIVSDEFYFVQDGLNYLTKHAFVEAHPPLGMLQMATVIKVFGSSPFTWRIINAIEGALLVPLVWWLAWRLTKNSVTAAIAALLVVVDGFILTESRLGLINIPYILYGLTGLAAILKALSARKPIRWLVIAGVMMGLALSVKWLAALLAWPTIALWLWPKFFGQDRGVQPNRYFWLISAVVLVVLPLCIYALVWRIHFFWLGIPDDTWLTNWRLWYFHTHVTTSDIYHEPWWGWPILWQPFLHLSQTAGQKISVIWSMGNPFVWWTGTFVFVYSLIRKWRLHPYRLLLILMFVGWLPFAFVSREIFLYTAIPFGIFLFVMIATMAGEVWQKHKRLVMAYIIGAVVVFLWFLPWYYNLPLTQSQYHLRQWLPTWKVTTPAP